MRLNHRAQLLPRQDLVHRAEKHVASRRSAELLEALVGGHGESLLLHGSIKASARFAVDLFQRCPRMSVQFGEPATHLELKRCVRQSSRE